MKVVVFAIDDNNNLTNKKLFYKYLDNLRVLYKLSGNPVMAIGSYKGKMEESFILDKDDFDNYIINSGYVNNQESFLVVSVGYKNKMSVSLMYKDGRVETLGRLFPLTKKEALSKDSWTYRPDLNQYWGVN